MELISGKWLAILAVAAAWSVLFSMFSKPRVRRLRNLGLLACFMLGAVMMFRLPWLTAVVTWGVAGVFSGLLYFCYEVLAYARAAEKSSAPRPRPATIVHGLALWPIMLPEAIEYLLAELGEFGAHTTPSP